MFHTRKPKTSWGPEDAQFQDFLPGHGGWKGSGRVPTYNWVCVHMRLSVCMCLSVNNVCICVWDTKVSVFLWLHKCMFIYLHMSKWVSVKFLSVCMWVGGCECLLSPCLDLGGQWVFPKLWETYPLLATLKNPFFPCPGLSSAFYILPRAWKWDRKSQGSFSMLLIKISKRKFPDHHQLLPPLTPSLSLPLSEDRSANPVQAFPVSKFTSLWLLRALSISPLAASQPVEK